MNGPLSPAAGTPAPPPPPLKVFTEEALDRLRQRDEPPTAGEAELSGPWRIVRLPDGDFGVFRRADEEAGDPPFCRFASRALALLATAALYGLGRGAVYRVAPEAGAIGFPLLREGSEAGALAVFLADLAPALDVLDALLRSPPALALLLEAAGPTALDRAGRELGLRLVAAPD